MLPVEKQTGDEKPAILVRQGCGCLDKVSYHAETLDPTTDKQVAMPYVRHCSWDYCNNLNVTKAYGYDSGSLLFKQATPYA